MKAAFLEDAAEPVQLPQSLPQSFATTFTTTTTTVTSPTTTTTTTISSPICTPACSFSNLQEEPAPPVYSGIYNDDDDNEGADETWCPPTSKESPSKLKEIKEQFVRPLVPVMDLFNISIRGELNP